MAARAMRYLSVSTDQVSLVVKGTLCFVLAEKESLNVSTMTAVVTLYLLWAGDYKIFLGC